MQTALTCAQRGVADEYVLREEDVRVVEETPLSDTFVHRHTPLARTGLPIPDCELVRRAALHYGAEVRPTDARRVPFHAGL